MTSKTVKTAMLTHNYPDTTYGISDPQEVRPDGYCQFCGGEIYPGEACYYLGGPCSDYMVCKSCVYEGVAGDGKD